MNVPLRKPRDKQKLRKEYLANLALSASNDQLNLNAQKMYKSTGASSLLADNITKTEKQMGEEGYKNLARDFLSGEHILNSMNASDLVHQLSPDDMRFIYQYKDFVAQDFKGREVPVSVFKAYIQKLRRKIEATQGVDFGLQQTGSGLLLSPESVFSQAGLLRIQSLMRRNGFSAFQIRQIEGNLQQLESATLDAEEIQKLKNIGAIEQNELQEINSEIVENIPTIDELEDAIVRRDAQRLFDITTLTPAIINASHELKERIRDAEAIRPEKNPSFIESEAELEPPQLEPEGLSGRTELEDASEIEDEERGFVPRGRLIEMIREVADAKGVDVDERRLKEDKNLQQYYEELNSLGFNLPRPPTPIAYDPAEEQLDERQETVKGYGMRGSGLRKKTPKDRSAGYNKPKVYRQFGRHMINEARLRNNELMIKYPSGSAIRDLPTKKISNQLRNALMKLTDNVIPDLSGLGIDDKNHLHHIIRQTNYNLPIEENDDEDDKEHTRFKILTGEVLAGNDSKEVIKELKMMLIKFKREGRISNQESNSILEDLLHMGH